MFYNLFTICSHFVHIYFLYYFHKKEVIKKQVISQIAHRFFIIAPVGRKSTGVSSFYMILRGFAIVYPEQSRSGYFFFQYICLLTKYEAGRTIDSRVISQLRKSNDTFILGNRRIMLIILINDVNQKLACL